MRILELNLGIRLLSQGTLYFLICSRTWMLFLVFFSLMILYKDYYISFNVRVMTYENKMGQI